LYVSDGLKKGVPPETSSTLKGQEPGTIRHPMVHEKRVDRKSAQGISCEQQTAGTHHSKGFFAIQGTAENGDQKIAKAADRRNRLLVLTRPSTGQMQGIIWRPTKAARTGRAIHKSKCREGPRKNHLAERSQRKSRVREKKKCVLGKQPKHKSKWKKKNKGGVSKRVTQIPPEEQRDIHHLQVKRLRILSPCARVPSCWLRRGDTGKPR